MKISTERTLIIITITICFLFVTSAFLYLKFKPPLTQQISSLEDGLKEIIDEYITKEEYDEGIDYLESLKKGKDKKSLALINHYLSHLRYNRLNKLSTASKWQEYHKYKSSYTKNILTETETVLENLPQTKYALEAQFLRCLAYKTLAMDAEEEEEFDKFKESLSQYCNNNKEYNIIKEYALRLYGNNNLPKIKELDEIYLRYLQKYLSEDKVKIELKVYADTFLKEEKYHASSLTYDKYIKLVFKQESQEDATLSLKEIIENYIKVEQFDLARKYAKLAITKYPQSTLIDYFQLKLARSFFELKKPEQAKRIYYRSLEEYPDSKYKENILQQLAEEIMIYSFEDRDKAVNEIKELERYTSIAETEACLLAYIADIYFLDEEYEKALNIYNDTLDKYPDTVLITWIENQIQNCKEGLKD